jgi:hypothetical protein
MLTANRGVSFACSGPLKCSCQLRIRLSKSRNRALADIITARQFLQRGALRAPSGGLFLLGRCQGGGPPHALSLRLGAGSSLCCAAM